MARGLGSLVLGVLRQGLLEELDQFLQLLVAEFVELQLLLDQHFFHVDHAILHGLEVVVADGVDFLGYVIIDSDGGVIVGERSSSVLLTQGPTESSWCIVRASVDSVVTVVDDFLAYFFGNVGNVIVVLLPDPVEEVEGVVLAQMPVELRSRAKADEDLEDRDDYFSLSLIFCRISQLANICQNASLAWPWSGASSFLLESVGIGALVFVVDVSEVVCNGDFGQLDQGRDALPVEDGAMELDELRAVQDDLHDLLDLLQATLVLVLYVREEELEKVLAHFVVDDGLARYFLLLHRELVQYSQAQAQGQPDS